MKILQFFEVLSTRGFIEYKLLHKKMFCTIPIIGNLRRIFQKNLQDGRIVYCKMYCKSALVLQKYRKFLAIQKVFTDFFLDA